MYVPCWKCGEDAWYATQLECRRCRAALRRCVDCEYYRVADSSCARLRIELTPEDASSPTRLSTSYSCSHHKIGEAAVAALRRAAQERAREVTRAAATARPAPAQAPSGEPDKAHLPEQPAAPPQPKPVTRPRQAIVIAHRGASALAPENTVSAIKLAIERGAQAVEIDVHLTQDGHPIVIHDGTVERTTDRYGAVAELTLESIRRMDAGTWFAAEYAGERIPTLAEALQAVPAPAWVNIHLRPHENASDRVEKSVADAIKAVGMEARVWVTHHTRHGLYRLRQMLPEMRLCWTSRGGPCDEEYIDDAYYMGYRMLQSPCHAVTPEFVAYAHERHMWVNVSHVTDEEQMRNLVALKVDGIFCDDPAVLRTVLAAPR